MARTTITHPILIECESANAPAIKKTLDKYRFKAEGIRAIDDAFNNFHFIKTPAIKKMIVESRKAAATVKHMVEIDCDSKDAQLIKSVLDKYAFKAVGITEIDAAMTTFNIFKTPAIKEMVIKK